MKQSISKNEIKLLHPYTCCPPKRIPKICVHSPSDDTSDDTLPDGPPKTNPQNLRTLTPILEVGNVLKLFGERKREKKRKNPFFRFSAPPWRSDLPGAARPSAAGRVHLSCDAVLRRFVSEDVFNDTNFEWRDSFSSSPCQTLKMNTLHMAVPPKKRRSKIHDFGITLFDVFFISDTSQPPQLTTIIPSELKSRAATATSWEIPDVQWNQYAINMQSMHKQAQINTRPCPQWDPTTRKWPRNDVQWWEKWKIRKGKNPRRDHGKIMDNVTI